MATNSTWTVIFNDKKIIKKTGDMASTPTGYDINDDSFWNQAHFSNIWAIQYGNSVTSDEVEYRDTTPHSAFDEATHGAFSEFTTRWDAAHLAKIQNDWDNDNVTDDDGNINETAEEKINRLGARPTSYSS